MGSSWLPAAIICGWYFSNIGVILSNKVLLSEFDFRGPIFLTLCHMLCCSLLSYCAAVTRLVVPQKLASRRQLAKIVLLAVIFLLTIVLGNISLRYIPVSFNQAIGSTTPAFTALLAFLLFRETETARTYLSLIPVVVGIIIASNAEPLFDLLGFAACLTATSTRALKSVIQGRLLSDASERMDSMSLLGYMAPAAAAFLVPMTLFFEPNSLAQARELGKAGAFWVLLLLNSAMAWAANLTNFLVTKHTSALTLQVLGNAKGVVAVALSLLYFRNPATFSSVFGYAVTVAGVVLYSQSKMRAKQQQMEKLSQPQLKDSGV
ncbi:hypothetical protein ABPG77_002572 [Micractinium sp. CCAP 211/92]